MKRIVALVCVFVMLLSAVKAVAEDSYEVREQMAASYGSAVYIDQSSAIKEYSSNTGFADFEYGYIVTYQGGFGGGGADASIPIEDTMGFTRLAFDARIIGDDFCSVSQLFGAMYPEDNSGEADLSYPVASTGSVRISPHWDDEYEPGVNYPEISLTGEWRRYEMDISGFKRFRLYIDALGAQQGAGECSAVIVANVKLKGNSGSSGNLGAGHTEQPVISDWAVKEVEKALEYGIIRRGEFPIGNYKEVATREIFAIIISNTMCALKGTSYEEEFAEMTDNNAVHTFDDTANLHVAIAAGMGIVNGVGDNKFAPEQNITRQEIAVMMYRAIKYMEEYKGTAYVTDSTDISRFADAADVADWAVAGTGTLAANGIMNGTSETTLSPLDNTTKEQAIALAVRIYEMMK